MLRPVEDEPERRRLVLRADSWGFLEVARRLLVTALSLAAAAAGVALIVISARGDLELPWLIRAAVIFFPFGVAWFIFRLPDEEVAEIVVDGPAQVVRVRVRGRQVWRSVVTEARLDQPDASLCLRAGVPPRHGYRRPELGLQLSDGPLYIGPMRLLAPSFSIEGVDRRDEARLLAEALARRLDLGLRVRQDDAFRYEAALAASLPRPPALVDESRGYRRAPRVPKLARDAPPGFEPPPNPPALDLVSVRDVLGLAVTRDDAGALAVTLTREPTWLPPFVTIPLAIGLGSASLSWLIGQGPWAELFDVLTFIGLTVGSWALFLTNLPNLLGHLLFLFSGLLTGFADARPHWFNRLRLARWRLEPGLLSGPRRRQRWRRGDVVSVVILDSWDTVTSRSSPTKHYRKHELYLFAGVWVRLAGTPQRREDPDKPAPLSPAIIALAIEVARELDAPLHWSG